MDIDLNHPVVKKANSASSLDIRTAANIPAVVTTKSGSFSCDILHAAELADGVREQMWLIFEENMKSYYSEAPSFTWDPITKKEQMFHELARIVLLSPIQVDQSKDLRPLQAFAIFRFEREDERNMIYCYELQVRKSAQRSGLGKALLDILEKIGTAYSMPCILLTAITANESAVRFYERSGFETDITSPDYESEDDDDEEPAANDYVILCKNINKS